MVSFSILFSLLCYTTSHVLVFWVSYELSILPLLFLLVGESSYSERFIAFWYLLGYVVLTRLPLLLSIFYLYGSSGGFHFMFSDVGSLFVLLVLCVCFVTKIPLPPFHVWLPIVHAEARSPVSVCLRGFIMKLGVLGVFRFASLILPSWVFSQYYVLLIFCLSLGFLLLSSQELDGKRWLAILSLSHIVLSALGLMVVRFTSRSVPFAYCLGHGFSAGVVFLLLWLLYDGVGSRKWGVLKFGVRGSLIVRVFLVGCLCRVASFPPSLSFFSEVRTLLDSGFYSLFLLLVFFGYLFFRGLMPLFVVGGCLSRHFSIGSQGRGSSCGFFPIFFLLLCCFLFFILL